MVEVNFISGRKAVLTIFKDGQEQEKITLSDYNDKEKLHQLFAQKGFAKYTAQEMVERRKMEEVKEKQTASAAAGGGGQLRNNAMKNDRIQQLSAALQRRERKEQLRKLKQARENFMVVGQPVDKK
mmetsp:Transcript_12292/g.26713  ORF Transcript_12292/g.26713 Transcript_12292/m.26713 type:complete len:126 (-) Transcript_12292:2339-2716(-)